MGITCGVNEYSTLAYIVLYKSGSGVGVPFFTSKKHPAVKLSTISKFE
jgi:hypothetical protein